MLRSFLRGFEQLASSWPHREKKKKKSHWFDANDPSHNDIVEAILSTYDSVIFFDPFSLRVSRIVTSKETFS